MANEIDEILHKIGSDINKVYTSDPLKAWCTVHYFKLIKGKCVGCEAKAAIDNYTTQRVIEELERLEADIVASYAHPPVFYSFLKDRLKQLKGGIDG